VSLQRITSGNHWPSDVYAAAVSGGLISRTLLQRRDARHATEAEEEASRAPRADVLFTPTFSRSEGLGARIDVTF
jgi:membrane-associated phospholipid phosphatase